ncbi:MAG: class I SAM-dependent methyltransferase [Candidatus Deferrimicrobium sp.]
MTLHGKRIDFLAKEHSRLPTAGFVRAVNESYYGRAAGDYDATPDIAYDAVVAWKRVLDVLIDSLSDLGEYFILDIGSGTGFVAGQIAESGWPVANYIGYEPSAYMRSISQKNVRDPRASFLPLDVSRRPSEMLSNVRGKKVVTMNSVLHHIVWWEDFLADIAGVLRSGDVLVLCHEPNRRFWENASLVQAFNTIVAERKNTRPPMKYLNPLNYGRKLLSWSGLAHGPRTPADSINRELRESGAICKDLPPDMIGAIIDYSVPLCWRNIPCPPDFDEGFFDIEHLTKTYFQGFRILDSFTYQYLAFSPSILPEKWIEFEKDMAGRYPSDGAQFCMIIMKS